jgi:2-polyprenyl-6-methoxyphenol hydroxylase-like FAD-dependent oxidoreductase
MQKVLEGIDHLFRSDDQIMRSLRHIGVNLADSQAALKQFFMQKALGVAL